MSQVYGLRAAGERTAAADSAVARVVGRLEAAGTPVALVALGAYGRRELTPRGDVDVLFLHADQLEQRLATEAVCYPLWEQHIRIEPLIRRVNECAVDVRKSLAAATSLLDARLVAGNAALFDELARVCIEPLRRNRKHLRQRLQMEVEHRHATHPPVTSSSAPDIVAGRGGLADATHVSWLEPRDDPRLDDARDLLLAIISVLEELTGHTPHRFGRRLQENAAEVLELDSATNLARALHQHARWVAFRLDSAFALPRDDRQLGPHLELRRGTLIGSRMPSLEAVPSLGLRVANLVGFAPPDEELIAWASEPGDAFGWSQQTLDQFWLLLRAADWRAFDFLDVTGLLVRYLPEFVALWRTDGVEQTLDTHSFLALRRLHEWTDSGDPFANRVWRSLRQRDLLYLAVLLHELDEMQAASAAQRLGFSDDAAQAIGAIVGQHQLVFETASQRDLHDEDLLVELATRIGTPQRLRQLLLVGVAHELAAREGAFDGWQAELVRQLFFRLDALLRHRGEVGPRTVRSIEHHRRHIVAELERRGLADLVPVVGRLPRRYVLTRAPALVVRHLRLLSGEPLADGEVRLEAVRQRGVQTWDILIVARDRPGLLATFAGVLSLRGASVLAADAATCSDGLVLDVFTVSSAYGLPLEPVLWKHVRDDLRNALEGRLPLEDLLGARSSGPDVVVRVDNAASQFYSLIEVRAADEVGLLYRIASALHGSGLDIHHAKITTRPDGALDTFYVWDLDGNKIADAAGAARAVTARLRGADAASA